MKNVIFHPLAEQELIDATAYYEVSWILDRVGSQKPGFFNNLGEDG